MAAVGLPPWYKHPKKTLPDEKNDPRHGCHSNTSLSLVGFSILFFADLRCLRVLTKDGLGKNPSNSMSDPSIARPRQSCSPSWWRIRRCRSSCFGIEALPRMALQDLIAIPGTNSGWCGGGAKSKRAVKITLIPGLLLSRSGVEGATEVEEREATADAIGVVGDGAVADSTVVVGDASVEDSLGVECPNTFDRRLVNIPIMDTTLCCSQVANCFFTFELLAHSTLSTRPAPTERLIERPATTTRRFGSLLAGINPNMTATRSKSEAA